MRRLTNAEAEAMRKTLDAATLEAIEKKVMAVKSVKDWPESEVVLVQCLPRTGYTCHWPKVKSGKLPNSSSILTVEEIADYNSYHRGGSRGTSGTSSGNSGKMRTQQNVAFKQLLEWFRANNLDIPAFVYQLNPELSDKRILDILGEDLSKHTWVYVMFRGSNGERFDSFDQFKDRRMMPEMVFKSKQEAEALLRNLGMDLPEVDW